MNIDTSLVQLKFNVSHAVDRSIKYIVVHNTGTSASAKNNVLYFRGANRNASADFFIDTDGSIWQFNADPKNYYSWHCGDGNGKYGITNSNSIGIECVAAGTSFAQAQKDALKDLIAYLKKTYGASEVVRHYDASRKKCPAYYVDDTHWAELKAYITGSTATTTQKANSGTSTTSTTTSTKTSYVYSRTQFIRDVQSATGATIDGIAGPDTLKHTVTVSKTKNRTHAVVRPLQQYLNLLGYSCGTVDGVAGPLFDKAVRDYQRANGCTVDGEITAKCLTWKKLLGLS